MCAHSAASLLQHRWFLRGKVKKPTKFPPEKKYAPKTKFKQFHLLQPQFLLNKIFEFIGTTTCSFDDFCLCIDKMVFDEI